MYTVSTKSPRSDVTFTQDGSGAYPDTHTKHFAINLTSGSVIKAFDVFVDNKRDPLAELVNCKLQSELKQIQAFEPGGRYSFSYSELKPYIKRDGLLGQFIE